MRRLLERQQAGELATRHVRAVAETVGVSERTVWALLGEVGGNSVRYPAAMSLLPPMGCRWTAARPVSQIAGSVIESPTPFGDCTQAAWLEPRTA
ncbi:hypothetical protein OHU34_42845 [Streptomyces sp. NBC_00080]|uniref:hypothetical protein n=1 Tax=Streptomyces sp. NBC_00080 TaxID=2975645 RepID=UPI003250881B